MKYFNITNKNVAVYIPEVLVEVVAGVREPAAVASADGCRVCERT